MQEKKKINKKAPSWTLLNQDNEKISLKDFLGQKVVLYFYPKALTPGCTVQAQKLRDEEKTWKKLKVKILGVSPDPVEKLKKFHDKEELNFDLLSDPDHLIASKYEVWGPKKFMGKTYEGILRTTFIIDEEGKIIEVIEDVKTKTHHETVQECLLRFES